MFLHYVVSRWFFFTISSRERLSLIRRFVDISSSLQHYWIRQSTFGFCELDIYWCCFLCASWALWVGKLKHTGFVISLQSTHCQTQVCVSTWGSDWCKMTLSFLWIECLIPYTVNHNTKDKSFIQRYDEGGADDQDTSTQHKPQSLRYDQIHKSSFALKENHKAILIHHCS